MKQLPTIWLGILVFLFLLYSTNSSATIKTDVPPVVEIFASDPHQFGTELGKSAKSKILEYCEKSVTLQKSLLPYYETSEGRKVYDSFLGGNELAFPSYMKELRALSDAAGIPFHYAFLLMSSNELLLKMPKELARHSPLVPRGGGERSGSESGSGAGCSDVYIHTQSNSIVGMAHNEDAEPIIANLGFYVHAHLNYSGSKGDLGPVEFYAFTYPAHIPGNAFGWNSNNVYTSLNAVFPRTIDAAGPTHCFVGRAVLDASSVENAVEMGKTFLCAGGVSLNVGDGVSTLNMETYEGNGFNILEVGSSGFFHANEFLHLSGISQHDDKSSDHRLDRYRSIGAAESISDLTKILGDHADPKYPIYRNAVPPDGASTAASVLYDFTTRNVSLFCGNPSEYPPVYQFPMF